MSELNSKRVASAFTRTFSLRGGLWQGWPHWRPTSAHAIWGLNVALILASVALVIGGAGSARPTVASLRLPFWALLLGFAAAERFVAHVHFRNSAYSISLGEIPLVFGLLFATGHDLILAAALGRVAVLAVHRRLPGIRLAFNAGAFLLWGSVAVLVFHAVTAPAAVVGPGVWAAAAAATGAASVLTALLITAAVSISEGPLTPGQVATTLGTDLAVAAANTSLALCAARLVSSDWRAGFLMAVPVAAMFVTVRAYISERHRHERLEFLYEAARTLSCAAAVEPALEGLLAQALEAFRAEVAELILFSPGGDEALRTTVHAAGPSNVLESVEPEIARELRTLTERQDRGACRLSDAVGDQLVGYLESRALSDGLFAVLKGERTWIGAMVLGNPSGVVHTFSREDLKLFETLANNTSVALENDRLGQAVWQMTQLQGDLEHQASHDALTDLANRALFADQVRDALRSGGEVAVIFIDIDDFKTVNDSLGHAAGDQLLISVARQLRACVRPGDVVARLGGDEFAIMLKVASSEQHATEVADRIIDRLSEPLPIARQEVSVRASVGIALGKHPNVGHEELIRKADIAMYRVKQEGKNGYQLFTPGMEEPVLRRHGLKQRLEDAVKEDRFIVHYQPIASLETGRIVGFEALVRWLDGPSGPVRPDSFIPIAEEMGVIVPIGRSVLQRACRDAQRWAHGNTMAPAVHVNLSPVELHDPGLAGGVLSALNQSRLSPHRLVLEIAESAILEEPEESIASLNQLHELGVRLALDDFGTGDSSLSHLRSMAIDWLKLGRPFVDGAKRGRIDRSVIRMVIELAGSIGVDVVAEGIESQEQLESLQGLGCRFGQGFYLGRPALLGPTVTTTHIDFLADRGSVDRTLR